MAKYLVITKECRIELETKEPYSEQTELILKGIAHLILGISMSNQWDKSALLLQQVAKLLEQ